MPICFAAADLQRRDVSSRIAPRPLDRLARALGGRG
jgi:hypothetical protein